MSSIGQGSISIDDSTRIGENAQDTANEVAGNINDINSDNKLTPTEKLKLKQEYDKDVELYNIDIKQLKSVNLPTAELETAMSDLTDFVTPLFKEMNRTSTVDRGTLDSVFTVFATADKNASQAFVNMVQQVANDARITGEAAKAAGDNAQKTGEEAKKTGEAAKATGEAAQKTADEAKKAGEDAKKTANEAKIAGDNAQKTGAEAKIAGDNAQKTGEEAKKTGEAAKKAASQAQADAIKAKTDAATAQQKAQSSIDQLNEASTKFDGEITSAKNSAQQALDNITVVDSKVDKLSTSTTAQFNTLNNGYQEVISSKVSITDFNNLTISNRNLALGTATAFTMTGDGTETTLNVCTHYRRQ